MSHFVVFFSLILSSCFLLVSCYPTQSEVNNAACNDLKSKIVFNGATSDTRRSEIEKAERPLDEYTYDQNCEIRR